MSNWPLNKLKWGCDAPSLPADLCNHSYGFLGNYGVTLNCSLFDVMTEGEFISYLKFKQLLINTRVIKKINPFWKYLWLSQYFQSNNLFLLCLALVSCIPREQHFSLFYHYHVEYQCKSQITERDMKVSQKHDMTRDEKHIRSLIRRCQ